MNQKNIHNTPQSVSPRCHLWTAIVTPFDQQGNIDYKSLTAVANAQAAAGNGIVVLGSTGEGLALTSHEQYAIVEHVCQLHLNTPIMVAVGGYNLVEQKAWIERCNPLKIQAFLLGSPLYAKPGPVGQTHWFSTLLDSAKHPCMLYNVPSRSGSSIPLATLSELQNHPNCWALKEASGDLNTFLAYRQHCPEVELYSGEDAMLPYLVAAGAKGLVSVCANAWPEATHQYVEDCLQGHTQHLFPLWKNAVESLFSVANPIPVKIIMHQQGVISCPVLRAPLTHLELENHANVIAANEEISEWLALC